MWSGIILVTLWSWCSAQSDYVQVNGVLSGNRMAGVPLGMSLGDGELDVEGICTKAGITCLNCTHSITCIPLPVGWLKIPLEQCPGDQTCNAHLGGCSSTPVPECDEGAQEYQHTCEQVGIFPDAYDCRKFHLCSPPEDFPDGRPADRRVALCPRHYGYDPRIAQCSIPLNNGQCTKKPVPICKKIGESGALESSPNHYYVCLSKHGNLYPQIFICPHGWNFIDSFCHPNTEIISTAATTATIQATEALTPVETTTKELNIVEPSIHKIEDFFSTEKIQTVPTDTFLADRFDLNNYDHVEDFVPEPDNNFNSFETDTDFW